MTKKAKSRLCLHCARPFPPNGRGRPSLYCSRSHRERAYEKRKLDEIRQPPRKIRRLFMEQLDRLEHQRNRYAAVRGLLPGWRPPTYERVVSKVRDCIRQLAPEVLEEPGDLASVMGRLQGSSAPHHLTGFLEVFRRLAQKYHPDHGGDTRMMQDLNELRQALEADIKRASAQTPRRD